MTNEKKFDQRTDTAKGELTDKQLDTVAGGTPRDAASGMATGKRTHKPVMMLF